MDEFLSSSSYGRYDDMDAIVLFSTIEPTIIAGGLHSECPEAKAGFVPIAVRGEGNGFDEMLICPRDVAVDRAGRTHKVMNLRLSITSSRKAGFLVHGY